MKRFDSAIGVVELTDERKRHILQFHPDIKSYWKHFAETLASPDSVHRSKFDAEAKIFYRTVSEQKKYLVIVVKTNHRNFILTAYLTYRIQH